MKYVVVNETLGCVYKFILSGEAKRIFRTRRQATQLCKELRWSFPDSKFKVIRCKTLSDSGYAIVC